MVKWCNCNFRYLRTPMGAVKLIHLIFGVASLALVAASYVPIWTLAVFTGTVTTCFAFSLVYMIFCLLVDQNILQTKANRVTSFIFHLLAGTALVVAGIELIGWSEYANTSCTHDCPRLYTVGVSKTLTFMNGVLYMIVGFLGLKDDDMLDADTADEDIPLLSSTKVIASIPGSGGNSKTGPYYFYDNFYRCNKAPYDDPRTYYYNANRPHRHYTAEHSFTNSYNSANNFYNAVSFVPQSYVGVNGNGRRSRTGSYNGTGVTVNVAHSVPATVTVSMPPQNNADLSLIKE